MDRSTFIKNTALLSAGLMFSKIPAFAGAEFPTVRVSADQRKFSNK